MRGHTTERGFTLVMIIGITAALAILAVALVALLVNQQTATANDRASKVSLYYAEAALSSAASAVESTNTWLTTPYTDTASMGAKYNTLTGAPAVTYRVYDNLTPVVTTTNWDSNADGIVWVETTTTYNGRSTRVRELVGSSTKVSVLPKAAVYADTDVVLNNTSNVYGVKTDGTADDSGAPYATTIMVGGDFTANSSTTLAYPGHSTQSLGLQVNGTVSTPGHSFSPTIGGVGLLSDYFDQAHQAALTTEAQYCQSNVATLFNLSPGSSRIYTSKTALLNAMTYNSSTHTYTASADMEYNNTGTALALNSSGYTYNFQSLYVNGSLVLGSTTTTNTTDLYISQNFTISNLTSTNKFGPLYVGGTASWTGPNTSSGRLGVQTTNYLNSSAAPGPVYIKILSVSSYSSSRGPFDLVFGNTWIDGDAGTSDVAITFSGATSGTDSTFMCPVLATTEKTVSSGKVDCGSVASPMVYYMQCDNDNGYVNSCDWASTGTYTGLMILFEAEINITGGNDGTGANPNVMGAVLEGTPYLAGSGDTGVDITLSGNSTICYNQAVIDNCTSDSLKTTTTAPVPGSWQQLKPQ